MRGTIARLSRLEAKRRPRSEARFYIFGLDEDDAAERYAAEIRAGTIQHGDFCHTPIWRGEGPIPTPRWAAPEELTDDELNSAIRSLYVACGRQPLAPDADEATVTAEMTSLRREILAEGSGL